MSHLQTCSSPAGTERRASGSRPSRHLAGSAKLQRSKWQHRRMEPPGLDQWHPRLQAWGRGPRSAKAGSGGDGLGVPPSGIHPDAPSQPSSDSGKVLPRFLAPARVWGEAPNSLPAMVPGEEAFCKPTRSQTPIRKVHPKENRTIAGERREGAGGPAGVYLFSLFCLRDLCRSPMSTTAARIPAFRQCLLPAGWDMARPPAVPDLARPRPRSPGSARSAPGPSARAPAPGLRLAWAPPRLGAPRGSGDHALPPPSRRPSASPRGPRGSRRPLPRRGHFRGSLRARPGPAAPGSRSDAPPAPGPAPAPPPAPRPRPPGWWRTRGTGSGRSAGGGGQRSRDPPARLPGALPGPGPASPRPLLLVPARTPAGGPELPPQAEAAAALPGPAPDTSPMLSLPLKQRARKQAPRGNARPPRSKRNCPRAVPVPSRPPRAYGGHLSPAPAPDRSSRARVPGWERMDGAE